MQTDMSVNSSSSLPYCSNSQTGFFITVAFSVTKIFLHVPLSILVLYLGLQRWRRQRSFATTSHSDIITYHMTALELIFLFGSTAYMCGVYTGLLEMVTVGVYLSYVVIPGQIGFHILTCVERYLAVVHPVTYMRLRQSGGVKIRNISIACVWLLSLVWSALTYRPNLLHVPFFCLMGLCLIVVSFCSLSVLCVLIRPGPGEMGGDRKEQVDQSKQRAFRTITAIMGVLWLFFLGMLVCVALEKSRLLSPDVGCVVLISGLWFNLPSSLVLPLLFLHRAGKLLLPFKK